MSHLDHTGRRALSAALAILTIALFAGPSVAQTEHRALSGERIAIYNAAGRLRVQGGSGSQVAVDVTRGGADASKLHLESGDIRGWQTLRVLYPADRVIYPELARRTRNT